MTLPRLVVATNNPGKLREFRALLEGCGFDLVSPADLGIDWSVEETGTTFEENARLKAADAARACGLIALADDSGLEVDYLGGRPGIFSARYAGPGRTEEGIGEAEQRRLLLGEMAGVPDALRSARFRCAIAIATPAGEVRTVDGVFEGRIAHEERGTNGFGYDPIFFVPEHGVTSAELLPDVKNAISHRGRAAHAACSILKELAHDAPGA
jgi:XTP/dITP diphosphohydrolase